MRIGIDIGGTKAHGVAVDEQRRIIAEVRLATGRGEREVLATARAAAARLSEDVGERPLSIGVGIPGSVDTDAGVVLHAVNLGVEHLALAAGMRDLTDAPVRVDNDVNAAALGAFGTLDPAPPSMSYLNVGTGLAAGFVLNGRVWRGAAGIAGEVGHIPIDPDGRLCPCGQRGCIETVASGSAIDHAWREERPFSAAVDAGDPRALDLLSRVAHGVADAVQIVVLSAGVDTVVLGGGVIAHVPRLAHAVRSDLAKRAARSGFLRSIGIVERVLVPSADTPVGAIGAALLGAVDDSARAASSPAG